jgi:hypothetical protein
MTIQGLVGGQAIWPNGLPTSQQMWRTDFFTVGCSSHRPQIYHDEVEVRRLHWHQGLRRTRWRERSVLLLAYALLAGVIAWTLGRRGGPWILRLGEPVQQRVRLAAGMLDTAVAAVGIAVVAQLVGEDDALVLGWTIGAAVSLGSVVYAAGLLAWRGGQALGLRVVGWVLMVVALVIPSTLTLGLPLVALLALTLAPIPRQRVARSRPAS